ncbi:TraR/DksA C4-type zinc finger protein [Shewanella sp. SR44-4]|uniref:TraR/DksA C4-type zinc finger protein n=1 Tax=Shewanella sp. SR44-4 TaxID=2760935 RepID=UPI0015FFED15|nr:TraR/DksA C4-type zinc finger protein [Shewanella sp. SR44-4]MBB1362109.1 TraR/DksA C4-type zinc finger protein [Shewanella sp. SR44-4]
MDDADRAGIEQERIEKAFLAKRTMLPPSRPSATQCIKCNIAIPEKRRQILPGVQLCVECKH